MKIHKKTLNVLKYVFYLVVNNKCPYYLISSLEEHCIDIQLLIILLEYVQLHPKIFKAMLNMDIIVLDIYLHIILCWGYM